MAVVKGSKELQAKLLKKAAEATAQHGAVVTVGYTAKYAIYVHQNKKMKWKGKKRTGKRPDGSKRKGCYWDPQGKGQSQFLLRPFREKRKEMQAIVKKVFLKTGNITLGLFTAGLFLQRESQKLVPVDSGNLKQSAFTKVGR